MATREDLEKLAFYKALVKKLFLIAYRKLGNKQDAEDVVQETWKDIFAKSNDAINQIQDIESYLIKILFRNIENNLQDHKKRKSEPPQDDNFLAGNYEPPTGNILIDELLKNETNKLKAKILYFHFVLGYTSEQVSMEIGKTPGYVRKVIHEFRKSRNNR